MEEREIGVLPQIFEEPASVDYGVLDAGHFEQFVYLGFL